MSDCRSSVSHANSARSLLTTAVGDAKTYRASHVTDMSDEQLRNLTSYLDQSAQQPSVPSCSIIANDGVLQTNAVNAKKLAHNATTLTRDLLLATTGVLPQELQGDEQTGDPSYSPSETQMPTESPQPPTSPSTDSSTHGTTSDDAKSHNDSGTANELASPSAQPSNTSRTSPEPSPSPSASMSTSSEDAGTGKRKQKESGSSASSQSEGNGSNTTKSNGTKSGNVM